MPAEEGGAGREEGIEKRNERGCQIVQVVPVVFKKNRADAQIRKIRVISV